MIGNKIKNKGLPAGRQGFTLIELLVGLTVFVLAISIAINLFSFALRIQRRSLAVQGVQDNGRYIISFIAKEIRMSEIRTIDGESSVLDFTHPVNGDIRYSFVDNQLVREDSTTTSPINSDDVRVSGKFIVNGRTADDNEQPRVTIVIQLETTGSKVEEQAKIDIQTTLTQRNLD